MGVYDWGRFGVLEVFVSGRPPQGQLEAVSAQGNLHKGLIGVGVFDVTSPTFKSIFDLVSEVIVCHKGVAHHAIFMTLDDSTGVPSGRLHLICQCGCGVDTGPSST
ncbi:hypothetical protein B296_00018423 [Ensete ventricosum]|uniref:Uncharacterized protein n=1 Tax=Ensete ventricosum TaxID=4639 RepID=A0A426Z2L9_ENSVE|nr:hypothetical protein B296_00018423 [Ensete ventricosum]